MDPLTLLALLSAALGGGAIASEIQAARDRAPAIWVKTAWKSDTAEAVELLSRGALEEVGVLFDLDLVAWEPMLETGLYRAFVIADLAGGVGRHVVIRARRDGYAWRLDAAFGQGTSKAQKDQVSLAKVVLASLSAPVPSTIEGSSGEAPVFAPRQIPAGPGLFTPGVREKAAVEAVLG